MLRTSRIAAAGLLALAAVCTTGPAFADDIDIAVTVGGNAFNAHIEDPANTVPGANDAQAKVAAAGQEAGVDVKDPAGGVLDGTNPGGPRGVRGSVVGYIFVSNLAYTQAQALVTEPQVTLSGALADPTLWTCSKPVTFDPTAPYTVSCTPEPNVVLTWDCDVLHADITTHDGNAQARTSMDCTGDMTPEAQTATATGTGVGSHDSVWATADIPVSAFSCTIDNGSGLGPIPRYTGGCGDPGAPELDS